MKQSELKRKTALKSGSSLGRGKKRRRLSESEREQAWAFKDAVGSERCAGCGRSPHLPTGPGIPSWPAHHVVYEQHCPDDRKWDPRNALPVCRTCHERHHNASRRIPLAALTEDNRAFAVEVLGEAADDYLRRLYRDG